MAEKIIDTHAHLYPARYLDFLEEHGASFSTTRIARNLRASDEDAEMDARLRQMDDAGVAVQVLSVTPQAPMLEDSHAALEAARMVNDIYIDTMKKYPGRFQAYLALPVPHLEESLTILDEYFDVPGFVGVTLPTFILGSMSIAVPALDELYKRLNQLKARVYVHPTGGGAQSPAINDFSLEWSMVRLLKMRLQLCNCSRLMCRTVSLIFVFILRTSAAIWHSWHSALKIILLIGAHSSILRVRP